MNLSQYQPTERKTVFSPCRKYRYTLWRSWGVGTLPLMQPNHGPDSYAMFVGLNPSTADETQDDPTIRRCIDFAKRWGYGALCMTNLFAWRDTDPEKMKRVNDPVGADNRIHVIRCASGAGVVIAAWGKDGRHRNEDTILKQWFLEAGLQLHCLKLNKDGTPAHPLYLPASLQPMPFR